MQDTGATRESGPDEGRVLGQPFAGRCRRMQQGVVREALMRAEKGTQGLRDGAGEEAGRPGTLLFQVRFEPRLRYMLLTLGPVSVATGMRDALVPPTAVALREALSVGSATAGLGGADALSVRGGEGGRTRKGLWRQGVEAIAQGRHGRSPCMRALRRS